MTTEERNWKLYEESKKNIDTNTQAKWAANDISDKWLLTLASGSFGLSFAFIENLVKLDMAVWKPLLIAAWICLVVVIILELIAFDVISYRFDRANEIEKENLLLRYQGMEPEHKKGRAAVDVNRVMGYFILPIFIAGIGCLITFVARNIL